MCVKLSPRDLNPALTLHTSQNTYTCRVTTTQRVRGGVIQYYYTKSGISRKTYTSSSFKKPILGVLKKHNFLKKAQPSTYYFTFCTLKCPTKRAHSVKFK